MADFIVKYWLEFLFGIIALGLGALAKYYHGLIKQGRSSIKEDENNVLKREIKQYIDDLKKEIQVSLEAHSLENAQQNKDIRAIKLGVLFLWKRVFFEEGGVLLSPNHTITAEEYSRITKSHQIYNSLGGNNEGDKLYENITYKYRGQFK